MRRLAILGLLAVLAGCVTPDSHFEERERAQDPVVVEEPNGLLKLIAALLQGLAKNT